MQVICKKNLCTLLRNCRRLMRYKIKTKCWSNEVIGFSHRQLVIRCMTELLNSDFSTCCVNMFVVQPWHLWQWLNVENFAVHATDSRLRLFLWFRIELTILVNSVYVVSSPLISLIVLMCRQETTLSLLTNFLICAKSLLQLRKDWPEWQ